MRAITGPQIRELYQRCQVSAFRLETLQRYTISDPEERERERAWREGRPLPISDRKRRSLDLFRQAVESGRLVHRVHIVDLPLSDYVRYELVTYAENEAAGEQVWIADRATHPDLDDLRDDFALFDGDTWKPTVVFYRYAPDGELLHLEQTTSLAIAARCREQRDLALRHAVRLHDFLATVGV